MASSGHRIYPSEDMTSHSYNYRGTLQSRISDLDANKGVGAKVTLEEARWSDMRKRIGLPRLPKGHVTSPQDEILKEREELITFIKEHFHRKECKKFVPKPDQKVKIVKDLKCHCGDTLYNHNGLRKTTRLGGGGEYAASFIVPEEYLDLTKNERAPPPNPLPVVSWKAETSLQKITTNAFGKIVFDVEQIGGMKPAKYIRVSDTDSEKEVLQMMIEFWRIKDPVPPKLVISVIGGAKNFKLDGRMRETFSTGLIKAAKTTSAWLITSGFNMGVMKAVGQAVHEGQTFQWDNDRMTHVLRCFGIAPWGYIKGRNVLESADGTGMFNAHYRTSNQILHGQPVHLNSDHTHFIFVDDGMRNRYGGVADFRARFEKHVMSSSGLGVPVVLVVVEGGQDAILDVRTSLKHGIPVVLCAGTGRAADILAYAFSHTIKSTTSNEFFMKPKHITALANKLREAYGKSWGKNTEAETEKFITIVQECCHYKERINIFPINKHEDMDLAILTVLLKAQSGKEAADIRFNQLMLALTWNRADIAQEEIFREDVNWETGHLVDAMTAALDQDKVDFVKLLLKQGIIMKDYLTIQKLEQLYNKIPQHTFLSFLLQRSSRKQTGFVLSDIGDFLIKLLDKYDDEMFARPKNSKMSSLGGSLKPESSFKGSRRKKLIGETTDTDEAEEGAKFKRPYKELLIWAVLMNRMDLAMFFWEMGEEPISSAVAVTRLCLGMTRKIPKYQSRLREEFEEMKMLFERLAIEVLDECNSVDPEKAMMLVERKSYMWSKMSCLQMAASAQDQAFLSSVACQNSINTTWKHGILSSWRYVFLGILCPLFLYFVEVNRLGEKKLTLAQKLMTFYTAPMTKFGCYTISYIFFLGLFSFLVLVDFKPVPTPVEWVCIIWNFAFLTGEIHTFLSFPIPTWKGKIRDWFRLPNILDASNLVIVFIGFGLRWNPRFFFDAKMIYCFNVIIFYLRILKVYTANSQLGPKLIMIRRMLEELILFVMVLLVFLLAYGVASQGLLYPQRIMNSTILKDILYYPYWQLYGEIFLEEIETDESCLQLLSNTTQVTPFNNTCRTSNWMVSILLAAYLCVGNILLLNLLIAIFSHVFDTVEENSTVIWKFQMYFLVMEYDIKSSIIPPFNLIKHCYLLIKWIFRKTCCKKETESVSYLQHHLMYLQLFEKEMMANFLRREKSGEANKLEMKVNKLQKRVDELTKLIEDEMIADQHALFEAEMTTMGMGYTQHGDTQMMKLKPKPEPEPEPEPKKQSRWPSLKRVLKLRDQEKLMQEGMNIDDLFEEGKPKFDRGHPTYQDIVLDEVKKKHKKKKNKKDKERKKGKKREKHMSDEEKQLNINFADYEPKPDYSSKQMDNDSSPTRGRQPSVPRGLIPLSPRSSFLQSRSDALPWSDSEEEYGAGQMNLNPLNIQTPLPIPRELQSPDMSDEDNYSRSPRSSRFVANRRARMRDRNRISQLEDRIDELTRPGDTYVHHRSRKSYR